MKTLWIVLLFAYCSFSQQTPLTNKDIVDMVTGGIGEQLVIAKIRASPTNFDTSSSALVSLKASGLSDDVILAMINSQPGTATTPSEVAALELGDAVGLKKVFVESDDARSQLEITKILKKEGYLVVTDYKVAELVIKFDFDIRPINIGLTPGLFGGIYTSSTAEQKNGRFRVFVRSDSSEQLVYVKERNPSYIGKLIHKQAQSYTEAFLKEIKKIGVSKD